MEKEQLQHGDRVAIRQRHSSTSRRAPPMIAALLVLLAIFQWGIIPRHRPSQNEAKLRYTGESIEWEPCGDVNGRPFECSSIHVPMDQFDAVNSGDKVFGIPLIRFRGKNATENLFLNPGGPGGSGLKFLYGRAETLNAIVGEGFHLLSFDPRGVNASRPQAACYPDAETRRTLSAVRDTHEIEDSPDIYAWTQNFVRACSDTMGEHGKYINTPQTAADMNSILDAVGQESLVYWGFSYGTILGQTYAGLFPERSKRVIIDGVANQFHWYGKPLDVEYLDDTDNVFRGFFDECVKAGKNCSLSSIADSKEELWDTVLSFADALQKQPISCYVNSTLHGLIDHKKLWYNGIFPALYKPKDWYLLAERLTKLLQGNATEAFLAYGIGEAFGVAAEANPVIFTNDGVSGPEYWPQDRESLLEKILPAFNHSLFGSSNSHGYYAKQQWTIPRTHNYVPRKGVKTLHPLLILSTTYDPVCPLVSARSANDAYVDSRIVEVLGYGHCSIAVTSLCVAKHVREFLYEGKLPANYAKCEVDSPYFIEPEEDGKVVAFRPFDDPQDQRIHLAQAELARDWEW